MKRTLLQCLQALAVLVPSLVLSQTARTNVLLICVDDLRPELKCYGIDYIHSPNIDRLAAKGRIFRHHYVQAPTCGASRFTLLTGQYGGRGNNALFQRAARLKTDPQSVPPSMPAWFRQHGYTTVSVGKVSHHPGGLGGPDWNDPEQLEMPRSWDQHLLPFGAWQHPRGWMHGLAHGEIRIKAGDMAVFQSASGPDSIYPDGPSIDLALNQIDQFADHASSPFFLAIGILRPHLPFGAPAQYLTPYQNTSLPPTPHATKPPGRTTWHGSGEFMKYQRGSRDPNTDPRFALEVRKHYAACVSYADAQVGRLLDKLEQRNLADNTIVVLWGDHGWHLGEHAVWGKHTLFEESLRSPLIIRSPTLNHAGLATEAIVETLDLFPTLCELTRLPIPSFVQGTSLVPLLLDPMKPGHDAFAYGKNASTIRTETHRMILHDDGFAELYDHRSAAGETENIASAHPNIVKQLATQLTARLASPR